MTLNPKQYRMVIGLTGPIASGKGLASKAIQKMFQDNHDITNILLSDYIRTAVKANGERLNRDTLRKAGNTLRQQKGNGAWVKEMFTHLQDDMGDILIVDSIRNPGEIKELRSIYKNRVAIIATDADLESRIKRVLKRARQDDSQDPSEIRKQMIIEMDRNPEFGFDIEGCKEISDFVSFGKESKEERIKEIQAWTFERLQQIENSELKSEIRKKRKIA